MSVSSSMRKGTSGERLTRRRVDAKELDSVAFRRSKLQDARKDVALLERAKLAWNNLSEFREQRARANRFVYGDQWGDYVTVHVKGQKKTMTMREYLCEDGKLPQQTNQLKSMVNTIIGVLIKEQNEPVCNAIDRNEQRYGELLTKGLQANNSKNRINIINKLCAKDMIIGGLGVCKESYGYREGDRRRQDAWTSYVDPNYVILESTMRDPRFWDLSMIGAWYRMPFKQVVTQFVRSGQDLKRLKDIFGDQTAGFNEPKGTELTDVNSFENLEFMKSSTETDCCIAEIWTVETKERIRLHDWNEGTLEVIDADDKEMIREVEAINRMRLQLAKANGWSEAETPVIDAEYFVDSFWYCRMMAPDGTILWEEESPYPDRSHPFTVMATPFVDGRIAGYITDGIDHQIAINRMLVLQDWVIRNQVRGFTMIPKQLVPKGMDNESFVEGAMNLGNFFFYDATGAQGLKPEVFHAGSVNFNAGEFISTLKQLMESSTAISGAIQGKTPYSGTSAALYAQQTSNSSTPIASLLADIRMFMEDAATKKAKFLAKFYDARRWELIAGSMDVGSGGGLQANGDTQSGALQLNDVADLEFDVIIKESPETPVYRAIANDYLMQFFQAGAITLEELLENGAFPFADSLLQSRQARQANTGSAGASVRCCKE